MKLHRCKENIRFGVIAYNTPKGIISDIIAQCSKCEGYFIVPEHGEIHPIGFDLLAHPEFIRIQWITKETEE